MYSICTFTFKMRLLRLLVRLPYKKSKILLFLSFFLVKIPPPPSLSISMVIKETTSDVHAFIQVLVNIYIYIYVVGPPSYIFCYLIMENSIPTLILISVSNNEPCSQVP